MCRKKQRNCVPAPSFQERIDREPLGSYAQVKHIIALLHQKGVVVINMASAGQSKVFFINYLSLVCYYWKTIYFETLKKIQSWYMLVQNMYHIEPTFLKFWNHFKIDRNEIVKNYEKIQLKN